MKMKGEIEGNKSILLSIPMGQYREVHQEAQNQEIGISETIRVAIDFYFSFSAQKRRTKTLSKKSPSLGGKNPRGGRSPPLKRVGRKKKILDI